MMEKTIYIWAYLTRGVKESTPVGDYQFKQNPEHSRIQVVPNRSRNGSWQQNSNTRHFKVINPLNQTFPQLKALRPEIPSQKFSKKIIFFFFSFWDYESLQLSNQLQNQCNNIEIAFAGADMILIVHFHLQQHRGLV